MRVPRLGTDGTILPIPDVAGAKFSRAAADGRQSGVADQRIKFAAENFVAEAKFTAATGAIAEIETSACSFITEDGDAGLDR